MAQDTDPVGRLRNMFADMTALTQPFGPSTEPREPAYRFNGVYYPHFHLGTDFVLPDVGPNRSHQLYAPVSGFVEFAGPDPRGISHGFGRYVKIKAPNNYTYLYGHVDNIRVAAGQYVFAGDQVATQGRGSVGASTGPHVHFEIRDPNNNPVDPGAVAGNPAKSWTEIWWTVFHGMGLGTGYQPLQTTSPPDPRGTPNTPGYATASWFHTLTEKQYPSGGASAHEPSGEPNPTTCVIPTDPINPLNAGTWAAYYACLAQQSLSNNPVAQGFGALGKLSDPEYLKTNVVPVAFVLLVGVAMVGVGVKFAGKEEPIKQALDVTVTPAVNAGKAVGKAGARIGAAVATDGTSEAVRAGSKVAAGSTGGETKAPKKYKREGDKQAAPPKGAGAATGPRELSGADQPKGPKELASKP